MARQIDALASLGRKGSRYDDKRGVHSKSLSILPHRTANSKVASIGDAEGGRVALAERPSGPQLPTESGDCNRVSG